MWAFFDDHNDLLKGWLFKEMWLKSVSISLFPWSLHSHPLDQAGPNRINKRAKYLKVTKVWQISQKLMVKKKGSLKLMLSLKQKLQHKHKSLQNGLN